MLIDATKSDNEKLIALMGGINLAADSLLQSTSDASSQTNAQAASDQAFTDVSDTVKSVLDGQKFDPTITIDQGTAIKIYVNKDYQFPKDIIGSGPIRIIK